MAGRGVTVLTDVVEIDGKENRMWSDGPGKATLMVTRGLTGNRLANHGFSDAGSDGPALAGRTAIRWADDHVRARRFRRRHGWHAALRPAFGTTICPDQVRREDRPGEINLSEIECRGQVMIENVSRDAVGVTSHERMQLARLTINQQTGAISGDGPGVIRSTRFGDGLVAIPGRPQAAGSRPTANAAGNKLNFLRVDFQAGSTATCTPAS